MVAPSPELHTILRQRYDALKQRIRDSPELAFLHRILRPLERRRPGFNDALVRPGHVNAPGLSFSALLRDRRPLRGDVRTVVVLVDFPDAQFAPAQTTDHYARLWFTPGANSVRDYYEDVSRGLVRIVGHVTGPLRMPHPLRYYANGASGLGDRAPNARVLARDAASALVASGLDLTPYDNDRDGFVDAFVIVHAGVGAERTGHVDDLWSHKWVLDGGPVSQLYAYLTIPADCKLGVCAHELGHLAFGWPDLYDNDYTSAGVGDWCLMGSGSYNGGEQNPSPPSAWCLMSQGWVDVVVPDKDEKRVELRDVRDKAGVIVKLWRRDAGQSHEYFLVENRQRCGRDADLPGGGLLVWHIDDDKNDNTSEMTNYKVALVQGDGRRDLEHGLNRGDLTDPFPGPNSDRRRLDATSNPNTSANNRAATGIAIDEISDADDLMTFSLNFGDGIAI
jgi:M6 family metalloprotease-like protein